MPVLTGSARQELPECLQPAGGGADADDGKRVLRLDLPLGNGLRASSRRVVESSPPATGSHGVESPNPNYSSPLTMRPR